MLIRIKAILNRKGLLGAPDEEPASLKPFSMRPSAKMYLGMGVICLSYLTCWPLIGALGWLALELQEPLIFTVGSPVAYASSHGLFLIGAFIAGAEGVGYARQLVRWLARAAFSKLTKAELQPAIDLEPEKRSDAIKEGE